MFFYLYHSGIFFVKNLHFYFQLAIILSTNWKDSLWQIRISGHLAVHMDYLSFFGWYWSDAPGGSQLSPVISNTLCGHPVVVLAVQEPQLRSTGVPLRTIFHHPARNAPNPHHLRMAGIDRFQSPSAFSNTHSNHRVGLRAWTAGYPPAGQVFPQVYSSTRVFQARLGHLR